MSELIPDSQQSSQVVPTGEGALVERSADRLPRKQVEELQRTERVGLARLARLEMQAQLASGWVQAVAQVGQRAVPTVSMVSQLDGQLRAAFPLAVSRLQGNADMTALSLAEVVRCCPEGGQVSGMIVFLIGVVFGMLALGGLVVTWAVYAPSAAELTEKARLREEAQKTTWKIVLEPAGLVSAGQWLWGMAQRLQPQWVMVMALVLLLSTWTLWQR